MWVGIVNPNGCTHLRRSIFLNSQFAKWHLNLALVPWKVWETVPKELFSGARAVPVALGLTPKLQALRAQADGEAKASWNGEKKYRHERGLFLRRALNEKPRYVPRCSCSKRSLFVCYGLAECNTLIPSIIVGCASSRKASQGLFWIDGIDFSRA